MSDLIDRQQAIDALKRQAKTMSEWSNRYAEQRKGVLTAVNIIEDLPPAQPEPCEDAVGREDMLAELDEWGKAFDENGHKESRADMTLVRKSMALLPSAQPVTKRVVVVCGDKGTWDFGTYRGHGDNIHFWHWKKNTYKRVYWWMYKEDALHEPYKGVTE